MPDIKRRDKRQNNGTSFNKAEYGIGRPVGFNQDPRYLLLRAFYMGPLPNTYSHLHASRRIKRLQPRETLWIIIIVLLALSRFCSLEKKFNSANHGPIFYHWTKSTVLYSNDTRAECYTSFERWNGYRHRSNKFFFFLSFFHPARGGSERTVSRIAAPNVQRLTSRPATSNVFLSRRFIARFLLQDRGQCARAPFINR